MRKRNVWLVLFLIIVIPLLIGLSTKSDFYDMKTATIKVGSVDSTLMRDTLDYPVDIYESVLLTCLIDPYVTGSDSIQIIKKIYCYTGLISGPDSLDPLEKYPIVDSAYLAIAAGGNDTFLLDTLPLYGHFSVYDVEIKATIISGANDSLKSKSYATGLERQ
jgi:hypothetical protein